MQQPNICYIMIKYFTYHCRITGLQKYNTCLWSYQYFPFICEAFSFMDEMMKRCILYITHPHWPFNLTKWKADSCYYKCLICRAKTTEKKKIERLQPINMQRFCCSAATVTEYIRRWNCYLSLPVEENLALLHSRDLDRHNYMGKSNAPVRQRVDWLLTVTGRKTQHRSLYFLLQSIYPDTD